jgi:hypothetical protein
MTSLTYKLLVMEGNVMRLLGKEKGHFHSQAVGQWMRCDETAWQKKWALLLTSCRMRWDENASQNKGQYHSLSVGHGMRCDVTMKERVVSLTRCWS